MHRANASVVIALGLLGCASSGQRAALGWSLGGEAHVFLADDRFATDYYRVLTGSGHLQDTLKRESLVAVEPHAVRGATVLSARGSAPARLTLVRFHAASACGSTTLVTELVLAFRPGGTTPRSSPLSHVSVVALLDAPPPAGGAMPPAKPLPHAAALDLVERVAQHAEPHGRLVESFSLDPDKAADAGEVVALRRDRYAVGFRARYALDDDTVLVTGVAVTDTSARQVRWAVRPLHSPLSNGMTRPTKGAGATRYSLRGAVVDQHGGSLLLLDEIADVSPHDSRTTAVDPETGRVVAAQPLALRCP